MSKYAESIVSGCMEVRDVIMFIVRSKGKVRSHRLTRWRGPLQLSKTNKIIQGVRIWRMRATIRGGIARERNSSLISEAEALSLSKELNYTSISGNILNRKTIANITIGAALPKTSREIPTSF